MTIRFAIVLSAVALLATVALGQLATDPLVGAHVSYSGSFEAVTANSLTLRLDDGRLIDAWFEPGISPEANDLIAVYHVGDRCKIDFTAIAPLFDLGINAYWFLQVDAVHFAGRPNPRQLGTVLDSRGWRDPGNLLPLPAGMPPPPPRVYEPTHDAFLESARAAVLRFTHDLPD